MTKIEMVDLKRQYQKIKPEIDKAIQDVLDTTAFINGPQVQQFATELAAYNGSKHVIPCANGTDALQIAMMALDLQPGDEVISPSFTYFATVEAGALLGLTTVFVDVDRKTFTVDPKAIEAAITSKTKLIVPVHLYGQAANMEEILAIGKKHNIPVLEDNAQAIGGNYTFANGTTVKTGSMSLVGSTSFFPSKNLGCYGDGGALFTNDDALAVKMKMVASHGQKIRYTHELIGINSRLDTMQAAILRVKLQYLDDYCDARRAVADYYDAAFADNPLVTTPYRASYTKHVFHQYTVVLHESVNRDELIKSLADKGIPTMLYYPIPCHKQKAFENRGRVSGSLTNTDWLTPRVLSLPIHTEMQEDQLKYITENVLEHLSVYA
jgi:UDP-2-acetamido-2-deoxy-ribo-hexuluronate aminotransferase